MKRYRTWAATSVVAGVWLMAPSVTLACTMCFGAGVDQPTTRAIAIAMLLLVGATGFVWSGIGAFFLHLRRRARMLEPGDLVVTEVGDIRENDKHE